MAPKESLQHIRDWASTLFPDEFAKFNTYINTSSFNFSKFRIQFEGVQSSFKVDGVQVGSTYSDSKPVYAWKGTEGVQIGHKEKEEDETIQPHEDFTNLEPALAASGDSGYCSQSTASEPELSLLRTSRT